MPMYVVDVRHAEPLALCSTIEEAVLYVVNRFGKASDFDEYTAWDQMWYFNQRHTELHWRGMFSDIYIRAIEFNSATPIEQLTLFTEYPSHFVQGIQFAYIGTI